jgi:hypothetical protein
MLDDTELPDPRDDEFWTRYLKTCAALGVQPVSADRAHELIDEWTRAIAVAIDVYEIGLCRVDQTVRQTVGTTASKHDSRAPSDHRQVIGLSYCRVESEPALTPTPTPL